MGVSTGTYKLCIGVMFMNCCSECPNVFARTSSMSKADSFNIV